MQCLTCSLPPQVVFTRYDTEVRCTLSMVDKQLLIMECGFRPRGHPNVRMDGGRVIGVGGYLQLSRRQGLKYCDLPLHPSILMTNYNISIVLFRVKPSTSFNTHQTMFCTIISQYNICSTVVQVFLQFTPYLGDSVLTHEE